MDEAWERFDDFCQAARFGAVKAITHGGEGLRLKVAAIVLALVAGVPEPAAAQQVAALARPSVPAAARVFDVPATGDPVSEALASLMQRRCRPVSMAASIADRNLECRSVRGIGRDSSIDMLAEAEMLGELDGMPVFLSPSERLYVNHMESRGGEDKEWVPMLVMSRALVGKLLQLPQTERNAAMAFLLGRERALMRTTLDDAADFEGFQYACFVGRDLAKTQAGINVAMVVTMANAGPARQAVAKRQEAMQGHFDAAREFQAAALGEGLRQR